MKKLLITRTVTSVSITPYNAVYYADESIEEAVQREKDLPIEEWAEYLFEGKELESTTIVRVIEED